MSEIDCQSLSATRTFCMVLDDRSYVALSVMSECVGGGSPRYLARAENFRANMPPLPISGREPALCGVQFPRSAPTLTRLTGLIPTAAGPDSFLNDGLGLA